jgi:hypothetical protein
LFERSYSEYGYKVRLMVYGCGRRTNESLLRPSCEISLKKAKSRKPVTVGDYLILLCVADAAVEVAGEAKSKKSPIHMKRCCFTAGSYVFVIN